jgi:hypothetical protein
MMTGFGCGYSSIKYSSVICWTKENHKKTSVLFMLWSFVLRTPVQVPIILKLDILKTCCNTTSYYASYMGYGGTLSNSIQYLIAFFIN